MSKILSRFFPSDRCFAPGPIQMLSLRHLALDALIGTGAHYDGDDVIIEDVIFEADRLKDRVEREIKDLKGQFAFIQEIKNSRVQHFPNRFWRLVDEISIELFDEFNYSDATTTDEDVEWKEYFHNVYEIVVPDENQMYVHQVWDALPQPPAAWIPGLLLGVYRTGLTSSGLRVGRLNHCLTSSDTRRNLGRN